MQNSTYLLCFLTSSKSRGILSQLFPTNLASVKDVLFLINKYTCLKWVIKKGTRAFVFKISAPKRNETTFKSKWSCPETLKSPLYSRQWVSNENHHPVILYRLPTSTFAPTDMPRSLSLMFQIYLIFFAKHHDWPCVRENNWVIYYSVKTCCDLKYHILIIKYYS